MQNNTFFLLDILVIYLIMENHKNGDRVIHLIEGHLIEYRVIDGELIKWAKSESTFSNAKVYPISNTRYLLIQTCVNDFELYECLDGKITLAWGNESVLASKLSEITSAALYQSCVCVYIDNKIYKIIPESLELSSILVYK